MDEIKLGQTVLLKEMIGYDVSWTVMFIEGDKLYCTSYDESRGYESIIVHKNLVKKD